MRVRALGAIVALCVAIAGASPWAAAQTTGAAAGGTQQDEAAVRAVVAKYVEAREKSDPKALAALFTADADQLTSSGEWRRGRDAVVQGGLASSQRTGGTRTIAIETVRVPAPGVALADGRYEIAGGTGGENRRMWTSFVMTRGPDGWRIAAIRNMLPAPMPAAAAPAPR